MKKSESRTLLRQSRLKDGLCMYCGKSPHEPNKKGCTACLNKCSRITCKCAKNNPQKSKDYRKKIRKDVIKKYGEICECCGESRWQFLVIDHKNKDGNVERRLLAGRKEGSSSKWYLKLKREPIREDLRVLCYNCNNAIHIFGTCPHELERKNTREISQLGICP